MESLKPCPFFGGDTTMSAYDLLPEDDRAALDWVREHGGVEHVKEQGEALARRLSALAREAVADADPEDEAESLDVLERAVSCRLMPEGMEWPRFEDGAILAFEDKLPDFECTIYKTVRTVKFRADGTAELTNDGGSANVTVVIRPGERVKRPAPKVLDADGVEIELGDDLYSVEGGLKFHVSSIDKKSGRIATEAMFALDKWADPKMYTHRAPVLAADGKPLRVGDTVWYANGDSPQLKVIRIESDRVVTENARDGEQWWAAYILTHEQPDSWKRLEDDATQNPWYYCKQHGVDTDAARPDADLAEVVTPFARDLVRRARALAERGQ